MIDKEIVVPGTAFFRGGMNLYGYVVNNPIKYIDPYGFGKFGSRPLQGNRWWPGISQNPIDDFSNTEYSHEHYFYDDGSNVGYGPKGLFYDENPKGYHWKPEVYDDPTMKEAEKNLEPEWNGKDYCLFGHNCQDYADALKDEYARLKKEKEKCKK